MNIAMRPTARRFRAAAVAAVAAGAGLAGTLAMGGAAQASTAGHHLPPGFVTTDSCSGLAGGLHYSPGLLTSTLRSVKSVVLTGTTSGCSDIFSGPLAGTGTFTAIMSGKASVQAENFSGTFTINWPAGSGFNPSNGPLSVTESDGLEIVSGQVTSGFDTGSVLGGQYVVTGKTGRGTRAHPVTAQTYVNTQPLTLSRNEG